MDRGSFIEFIGEPLVSERRTGNWRLPWLPESLLFACRQDCCRRTSCWLGRGDTMETRGAGMVSGCPASSGELH